MLESACERTLLGVRPEHVRFVDRTQGLAATVRHAEYFGSHWIAELDTAAGSVKVVVDKSAKPQEGDHLGLAFDTQRIVMFDAASELLLPSASTRTHLPGMTHG